MTYNSLATNIIDNLMEKKSVSIELVTSIAEKVRKNLEDYYGWDEDRTCFKGTCQDVVEDLVKEYQKKGIEATKVGGVYKDVSEEFEPDLIFDDDVYDYTGDWKHWWVEVENKYIVDITSDQFHPGDEDDYRVIITNINDNNYEGNITDIKCESKVESHGYSFITSCVHSTAELIDDMVDQATEVSYNEFVRNVNVEELMGLFPDYAWSGKGLKLKDDWAVSYYKSIYDGKDCYYMNHSAIEYVFIKGKIDEATLADIRKKQKSITKLFPTFYDRVDKVKVKSSAEGIKQDKTGTETWKFKIHSGTKDNVWYDAALHFKDILPTVERLAKDQSLWTKDKSRVDLRLLARAFMEQVEVQVNCSCPCQQFFGMNYILSRSNMDAKYGDKEDRAPNIRNPKLYGAICKHVQALFGTLPFYITTVSKWLKDFYGADIKDIEQKIKGSQVKTEPKSPEKPEDKKIQTKPKESPKENKPKKFMSKDSFIKKHKGDGTVKNVNGKFVIGNIPDIKIDKKEFGSEDEALNYLYDVSTKQGNK